MPGTQAAAQFPTTSTQDSCFSPADGLLLLLLLLLQRHLLLLLLLLLLQGRLCPRLLLLHRGRKPWQVLGARSAHTPVSIPTQLE